METLKIEAGRKCKIDTGNIGLTIKGPVLIVVIKEKDLVEPSLKGMLDETE
ncbi:hypothetical protein Desde_1046 [Desulfitobacterium dehalogenans ATCC 51507]|uniref:Uncharacterized protein n=1 Tax=Desulfitobacterium dehalogenans (strain ATCC 51507 / DSM 9161 / JW/IU-DC1) TaxID=756499 RepID=I4A695_DESDJ|nr:hypothetical protein [Desulfitobacterium dehalogenans]AFL99479.1 hypothetical protein Desde_1046 [Desulfitobacterium dehalogenans ATCC 51507]